MKNQFAAAGAFVLLALLLFGAGLFLIGDRHKAFAHHGDFYTELANVNGLATGSKVRVSGFDAGEVASIQLPDHPSGKFRLRLHLDQKLNPLIRGDSTVSVESDGLVGDKFLLIHAGSDQSQEAASGTTLAGKEPVEISAILTKATGVIDQANATLGDVRVKLDGALDSVTATIHNANGLVTEARSGKGAVGVLLNDQQTASEIKMAVVNAEHATDHLNQITVQAGQLVTDLQSRELPAKIDDTLTNARSASQQLGEASLQVNTALHDALAPDRSGTTAAENIRESLGNVNLATANLADDTEALKHGFLFRGFFKKRGFYSLQDLTPDQYRNNPFFQNASNRREWLSGADLFARDAKGDEFLTPAGRQQVDRAIAGIKDAAVDQPIVVEGYSNEQPGADQLLLSREHAALVAHYLEVHFHLSSKNIGVMSLNATPAPSSGRAVWDGACIVFLSSKQ